MVSIFREMHKKNLRTDDRNYSFDTRAWFDLILLYGGEINDVGDTK